MTGAGKPPRVLIWVWQAANDGIITAGVVADHFHSGSVGNFTRNVYERTNGVAPVNNGSENRGGSKHGCRNNSVQSAERDTAMGSLTVLQEYTVKLHDRLRLANRQAIEGRAPRDGQSVTGELPGQTGNG